MPLCYVLPGILGSELDTLTGGRRNIWVHRARLALCEFDRLELGPNGAVPKPPRGDWCAAGEPLPEYYGQLIEALEVGLEPHGYQVKPWGYDWRLRIFQVAQKLADEIREQVTSEDPCSLVAHSQGGLVARAVWQLLGNDGSQTKIRRIVTLGTPHRGSYAPCLMWSLQEELIESLSLIKSGIVAIADPFKLHPLSRYWTRAELAAVTTTWPALYELMPLVDAVSEVTDPLREAVFVASNWDGSVQLSVDHLQEARSSWAEFLRSASSMPGADVLTTVAGTGFSTPVAVASVDEIGTPGGFRFASTGDGRVTEESALVPTSTRIRLVAQHAGLIDDPFVLSQIAYEVLDPRTPPVPPSPPKESPIVTGSWKAGPPVPFTADFGHDC